MRRGLRPIFTIVLLGACLVVLAKVGASNNGTGDKDKTTRGERAMPLTYTKDIAPILYSKCAECHRPGETAPFSVLSYKDVRPWARSIKEKVVTREMPPWQADPHTGEWANDRRLTADQIRKISSWVEQGAPEGNPAGLAPAPDFPDNWSIGKPDVVFQIPEEYTLDATGPDEYQYFDVPTNFNEDKYIQMAEARPGNRKIVHHIIVFVVPPGSPTIANVPKKARNAALNMSLGGSPFYRDGFLIRTKDGQPVYDDASQLPPNLRGFNEVDNFLTAYAPGSNYGAWKPGTAKFVPAHSLLRFQIHYSKVAGRNENDRSMVGLVFAKEPPANILKTRGISNVFFQIPPQADNHKVTAVWTPKVDVEILALMPHMHYRGKAMEYEATYPDGHTQPLLNVPSYSFSWQTAYKPVSPIRIPAGSTVKVTGYFDNSVKNKFNPDPTKAVRFGEPTYDEMMIGFLDYIVEKPSGVKGIDPAVFAAYEGRYQLDQRRTYTIFREGDRYFGQATGPKGTTPKRELFAISQEKFSIPEVESQITFVRDQAGDVAELVYETDRGSAHCKRIKDQH